PRSRKDSAPAPERPVAPTRRRTFWPLLALALLPAPLAAHPVEEKVYDRTLTVRLTGRAVVVEYQLEVNALTADSDGPDLVSKDELAEITEATQVYAAFLRGSAPQIGYCLYAKLDGKELKFVCKEQSYRVLDHLRLEYRFEAAWQPAPGKQHAFTLRETNY